MTAPAGDERHQAFTPALRGGHTPVEELIQLDPRNDAVLVAALTYELILRRAITLSMGGKRGVHVQVRLATREANSVPAEAAAMHLLLGPDTRNRDRTLYAWYGGTRQEIEDWRCTPLRRLAAGTDISLVADLVVEHLQAAQPPAPA